MKILKSLRGAIKFLICVIAISIYILIAFLLYILLFAFLNLYQKIMSRLNKLLAKTITTILNINIIIEGRHFIPKNNNFCIISNHLTYIDGVVLSSIFPVLFVSKKEVKSWPLFGQMASLGATIFIDRSKKSKTLDYIQKISEALKNNVNVLVFPEGTSTDGTTLFPFQTVFFSPPIISKKPILPVAINYLQIDDADISENNKNKLFWYGKMTFFSHLWGVLKLKRIVVKIKINRAVEVSKFKEDVSDRKELSTICYDIILKSINAQES